MPLASSRYVSPEEMAREAIRFTEVLGKVLASESQGSGQHDQRPGGAARGIQNSRYAKETK
ncbi:hypothetical protein ES703_100409 [subsurface metagenome]